MSFSSLVFSLSREGARKEGEMAFLVAFLTNAKFMWSGGGGEKEKVPLAALLPSLFPSIFCLRKRGIEITEIVREELFLYSFIVYKSKIGLVSSRGYRQIAEGVFQYDSKLSFMLG